MALANLVHDSFLQQLVVGNTSWQDGNWRAMLINTHIVGLTKDLGTVSEVLAGPGTEPTSAGYARADLTGCTTVDVGDTVQYQSDPIDFGTPAADVSGEGEYDLLVIFEIGTDDDDSFLAFSLDVSDAGNLQAFDGNPLSFAPSATGWAVLSST